MKLIGKKWAADLIIIGPNVPSCSRPRCLPSNLVQGRAQSLSRPGSMRWETDEIGGLLSFSGPRIQNIATHACVSRDVEKVRKQKKVRTNFVVRTVLNLSLVVRCSSQKSESSWFRLEFVISFYLKSVCEMHKPREDFFLVRERSFCDGQRVICTVGGRVDTSRKIWKICQRPGETVQLLAERMMWLFLKLQISNEIERFICFNQALRPDTLQ